MVIGMATHITPFKSKRYNFKVATLQLYIDEKCLILKLSRMDEISFPSCLRCLSRRDSKFIFAGIQDEERSDYLRRKCDFEISNGLDILEAARMRWPSKFGKDTDLKVVARELADVDLEQPLHVLQSNWKTSMLCLEQVEFATMEAYASYCVVFLYMSKSFAIVALRFSFVPTIFFNMTRLLAVVALRNIVFSSYSFSIKKLASVTFNPNTCTYIVNYEGKSIETTVTDKLGVADQWAMKYWKNKGKATVVGLANEGLKTGPITSINTIGYKVSTLQLYIDEKCLILKLAHMDQYNNSNLKALFRDSMYIFAEIQDGRRNDYLWNECGFKASNSLDIVEAAKMRWPDKFRYTTVDLKVVAKEVANVHYDWPSNVLQSNWETRMLCLEQVEYATMEAFVIYCLGHKLFIGD
ncbi:Werner Syndrome-like exonuclease [Senna tora]|uniref:Werner Syndrome-like exonuclease n=1 Tax=Senna tora TaxID=362788 RepID=A0A835CCT1_9FABA|nr:Werner Syndrome-like exonuclease [Senna tora]